ncbi:MAG: Rne/Rng family ribonuclease [Alphaproteobacteria bacterium]|nr:Rne/Rng family ribonuclease [Alphaproteobacteria bacterium]
MSKRMLVDASHPEETRVVVLDGNRVEEFDYESASRRPLKGNIYLAKVTRVEPSLQACFVDYGGNRHGFLAFSEIHPDYYQIPTADRQALLEANRAAQRREDQEEDDEAEAEASSEPVASAEENDDDRASDFAGDLTSAASEAGAGENGSDIVEVATTSADDVWIHDPETDADAQAGEGIPERHETFGDEGRDVPAFEESLPPSNGDDMIPITPLEAAEAHEAVAEDGAGAAGGDDAMEELPRRDYRSMRRYKIQEVIKRRQVLLVQVVKEERGNKGAALTTYLSLAGRYCVLMPNTDRGGGISRKISNVSDRRKLKEVAGELEVPDGMGVIIRTAGANRTKQEIKRDFEYLMRQWDAVRELTLKSVAPTLVYEEGNLIKRTIRDLYTKEIGDIQVEGEEGFNEAHGFMTMLMPSHADAVKQYRDHVPLFQRYGVETALDSMFNPVVRLRSGGYIVINQTEALVAIDVNSGKSTREHHIEDTALKTNLEAADEVARQLRLRDLAGLVVIDFIDMEEHRNNRSVEKRLKDALRHDRARIQLGRISPFGLLEMSRQRLRSGMVEGATIPCPHCEGRGVIRSVGSMALRVLRAVEEYCQREKLQAITLRVPPEIALYILNHKRAQLTAIEDRRGVFIYIEAKAALAASTYEIERGTAVPFEPRRTVAAAVTVESELEANDDVREEAPEEGVAELVEVEERQDEEQSQGAREERGGEGGRRRRRRRRGRDRDRERGPASEQPPGIGPQPEAAFAEQPFATEGASDEADDGDEGDGEGETEADGNVATEPGPHGENGEGRKRRRRRGRRGRRGRRPDEGGGAYQAPQGGSPLGHLPTPAEALEAPDWPSTGGFDTQPGAPPPVPRSFERFDEPKRPAPRIDERPTTFVQPAAPEMPRVEEPKPERTSIASFFGFGAKSEDSPPTPSEPRAQRKGWWQRKPDA